jgi:hypothetical protein
MTDHPIYDATITPDVAAALTRPRWSYDAALKAADEAIINRPQDLPKKATPAKRPAKKAAARKGAS